MRVLDLFSGIGGFSLGLERAGMTTVAFCEIDPYCRAVLKKHWPEVPCYEDVRTIPPIGGIDVICGGFPCQPWSHAGKQLGTADDRHLWPAMLEVIKRERPTFVVGENVVGIIGLALDAILADLEAIGYACRTFDIPAGAVGAPHIRRRVWIVACDSDSDSESACAFHDEEQGMQGFEVPYPYSESLEGGGAKR
jgi:DNA (cytosine-5)-methyltransferase 1